MNSWFLSTLSPWPLVLGLVVMVIGIALLYSAWQSPTRNGSLISLGWIALLLVHWPLGIALSLDRGWAIAAILPGFIALLWIGMTTPWHAWNSQGRQKPARTHKVTVSTRIRANQAGQVLLEIFVVGLLSFAAAIGVALALFSLLDASIVNRTVYAALLVMVLWPVLMVWSKAKPRLIKPAVYFVGISLGGLLFTPLLF